MTLTLQGVGGYGGVASLTYTATAPASGDWIGMYPVGAPYGSYGWWQYTNGATSGSFNNILMYAPQGNYEFRYYTGSTLVATSASFTLGNYWVRAPAYAVAGGTMTVQSVAPSGAGAQDWIGLYPVGSTSASIQWSYTGGATTFSYTFNVPTTPGSYEVRYYLNNGHTQTAVSKHITVAAQSISVTPNVLASSSSQVTINWTAPSGSSTTDWWGIYRVNAPAGSNTPSLAWGYTNGTTSGSWTGTVPSGCVGHDCEVRYFLNGGYTMPTKSAPFIVPQGNKPSCLSGPNAPNLKHLIVITMENHTFDSYMGSYCTAATGSNPSCTSGAGCCEKPPATVAGYGPTTLNDSQNMSYDPQHVSACETPEIAGGNMSQFVSGVSGCSSTSNFAVADTTTMATYQNYAKQYAMADHYFQAAIGASSENDMYEARGKFVYWDNTYEPNAINGYGTQITYTDPTIGDLMASCGMSWKYYAEGYYAAVALGLGSYDPGDNPFEYYGNFEDNSNYEQDLTDLFLDVSLGTLPAVSYVKPIYWLSEHPKESNISTGEAFVANIVNYVLNSQYANNTLIVAVPDESGGYYDHISPPATSSVDGVGYGPRLWFLAMGKLAKTNYISHLQMEHSSVIKLIEWNWFGSTGQLGTRDTDANIHTIGDLINGTAAGKTVP